MNDRQLSLNALERYKKQRKRYISGGGTGNEDKIAADEDDQAHRASLVAKLLGNSKEARAMKE